MVGSYSILVGTTGASLFRSPDGGQTWGRLGAPFPGDSQVRALAVDPSRPSVVYAGSNYGIFRSNDAGATWLKLDSPMDGLHIWSIAVDPSDSNTLFAGTSPPFLFRSRDGGETWQKHLPQQRRRGNLADIAQDGLHAPSACPGSPGTAMAVDPVHCHGRDPVHPDTVYAGVEIDGVHRSRDGGDTWARLHTGITNPDIHGMAFSLGQRDTVLVSTPAEIFASSDDGDSFQSLALTSSWALPYCRWIAVKPGNPQVVFAANGDGAIGNTGTIQRSTDGGKSWETRPLPVEPNSPLWNFATHPANPELVLASSIYGELYRSPDGGDSWEKLKKEFTEVRALAWLPS